MSNNCFSVVYVDPNVLGFKFVENGCVYMCLVTGTSDGSYKISTL